MMMNFRDYAEQQRQMEVARIDRMYEENLSAMQATHEAQLQQLSRNYKRALGEINQHYGLPDVVDIPADDSGVIHQTDTLSGEDMRRTGAARANTTGVVPDADDVLNNASRMGAGRG